MTSDVNLQDIRRSVSLRRSETRTATGMTSDHNHGFRQNFMLENHSSFFHPQVRVFLSFFLSFVRSFFLSRFVIHLSLSFFFISLVHSFLWIFFLHSFQVFPASFHPLFVCFFLPLVYFSFFPTLIYPSCFFPSLSSFLSTFLYFNPSIPALSPLSTFTIPFPIILSSIVCLSHWLFSPLCRLPSFDLPVFQTNKQTLLNNPMCLEQSFQDKASPVTAQLQD